MSNQPDSAQTPKRRVVALVGRPNVGKSAVFNRIAGRRIAIVFGEPGVTRDRLEREVERDGVRFVLADTGGILALDGERIPDRIGAGVVAQARAAIGDAGAVVLVVDVQEGLHPLDLEVARLLRKAGADAIVAANKADNPALDAHAADFARLGFPVFPVSALHGRGFDALMAEALRRLPPEPATPAPEDASADAEDAAAPTAPDRPLAVAIVGRPNCGKSSFVNRLLKTDRVIVSDVPGTTRDPIDVPLEYGGRKFVLVDTAGVRREARVDTAVERYSRYRTQDAMERADLVVLMLDSQRGAGLLDKQLAGMVAEGGKGCVIAVNKWDLEHPDEKEFLAKLAQDLPFMAHCPVVFLSAKTGFRVERVLATVAHVADAARAQLPTGPLNRCLQAAYAAVGSGGRSGGRPLRMYYATQTGTNPVRVRIFVNDPKRLPASLEAFLAGALRREFDLAGVGVVLQFRARTRADGSTAERAPAPSSRAAKKAGGKARTHRRRMARG